MSEHSPEINDGTGTPFTQDHVDELVARVEAAEERAAAAEAEASGKKPRYAVWDVTYEKFLPGVHADRKAAEKVAKDHDGRTKIREV